MPNTREKLIEFLYQAHGLATEASCFKDATYAQQLEVEADHLIANGVTVQEWISVKDRLPEKFHNVLAVRKIGDWFGIDIECIVATDKWSGDVFTDNEVTHWMPLPQPPMGNKPDHQLDECSPQKTNADRIRAMSDEELAEFLSDDERACPPKCNNCRKHISECGGCWLEWLKQPAEE